MTCLIDLVLDTGELIRIEAPDKLVDDLYESLDNAMKRGDWWAPGEIDGCSATLLGMRVSRVAMRRVVAML